MAWLEDEHDEAGNSAVGSTFAATAANIKEEEPNSETGNGLYYKYIFINNSTKGGNSEDTSPRVSAGVSAPVYDCERSSAANETDNGVFNPPILKTPSQIADNIGSTIRQPADSAANSPLLQHISSRDYKLLDHAEYHTMCMMRISNDIGRYQRYTTTGSQGCRIS
jgi:hypothetical protein